MRELLTELLDLRGRGEQFALATVVQTWSSAPRQPGAAMVVRATGEAIGSVSGGCVEGSVYETAREVLETGVARLVRFGVSDDEAFSIGLTCGGIIDVLVELVDDSTHPHFDHVLDAIRHQRPVVLATVTSGAAIGQHLVVDQDGVIGTSDIPGLEAAIARAAGDTPGSHSRADLLSGTDLNLPDSEMAVLVQSFAPPPRMIVFGAIDFAGAVARIGGFLGYHVTLCDARPIFATRERFPSVDEVVVDWPHRYLAKQEVDPTTVLCVLTHDPKFDIPLLEVALQTPAGYIGVMGSRRTHSDRLQRLREAGVGEEGIARLHSPVGLDLGARTPEETAVSIAAEIIATATGRSGRPLRDTTSAIHP